MLWVLSSVVQEACQTGTGSHRTAIVGACLAEKRRLSKLVGGVDSLSIDRKIMQFVKRLRNIVYT